MSTGQGSSVLNSLKMSGGIALGLGALYAIFMTVRDYLMNGGAGPGLSTVFVVSLLYCAVPLFVFIFAVSSVIAILQRNRDAVP